MFFFAVCMFEPAHHKNVMQLVCIACRKASATPQSMVAYIGDGLTQLADAVPKNAHASDNSMLMITNLATKP